MPALVVVVVVDARGLKPSALVAVTVQRCGSGREEELRQDIVLCRYPA